MYRHVFLFLIVLSFFTSAHAQPGCTDPLATNYNATATSNDGSCVYAQTTLPLTFMTLLDTTLDESSGIVYLDSNLWTHVDNPDMNIYRIDTASPAILQQVLVTNEFNHDWEDITSGPDYIYVGNFGNNSGARTDLRINRIARSSLSDTSTMVQVDTIKFSYPDQTDFTVNLNNNRFDCEAFFFHNDSLHLFAKDWVFKHTRHYVVPADTGTHIAILRDSFDVQMLVTSAAINDSGVIVLLGYNTVIPAPCYVWMFYDYPDGNFFGGNKRRFDLGSAITVGQTEGICFSNGMNGFISSERFIQTPFDIPAALRKFDLSPFLVDPTTGIAETTSRLVSIYPNPADDFVRFEVPDQSEKSINLFDMTGRTVFTGMMEGEFKMDAGNLRAGIYTWHVSGVNFSERGKLIVR